MRRLATFISHTFVARDVPPPPPMPLAPPPPKPVVTAVRERINHVLRRRLSDRVMDVFQEACVSGDLDTAQELLVVLEAMHLRRQAAAGERRVSTQDLERARAELSARKARQQAAKQNA